ncbi:MAG: ubiG 1 [Verrucomicrobiales bacterium]|nr:ubiG 1 [Verrucomicrobiales bacterium]
MNLLKRICPVCGAEDGTVFLKKAALTLMQCNVCSMVFASPVPSAYVDGSFYEDSGRPFYLSPEKLAGDFSAVRFARELALFRSVCARGRVLDVGCSTGAFLFQLKNRFGADYEIYGTDISGPPLDYAEGKGIPIIRGNFLTHDFQNKFDAVTFWAVLEHVEEPQTFVKRAFDVLNPGGVCIILVPNLSSLAVKILKEEYRYILPQHINYFNAETLRKMSCPPFEEMRFTTTHFNPIVIAQDWRGTREVDQKERAGLLVKTNSLKQNPLLTPVRWVYNAVEKALGSLGLADNCVCILRKPL